MDKCLLKKRHYDRKDKVIPLEINGQLQLAFNLIDLLDEVEIDKLQKYTEMLFANTDDNRRKKLAVIENKKVASIICGRIGNGLLKTYTLSNVKYEMDEFCTTIEVIQWVKDKFLNEITFNSLTKNKYLGDGEYMYLTFVIGIDPPSLSPITKLAFVGNPDVNIEMKLCSRISLMYCSSYLETRESIAMANRTQIFFHVRYRAQVVAVSN